MIGLSEAAEAVATALRRKSSKDGAHLPERKVLHSGGVLVDDAIDLLDVVARHLPTSRFHHATDKEDYIKRTRLGVKDAVLHNVRRERQPMRLWIKAINIAHVAGSCVADLIKLQWFVLKSALFGERPGEKVLGDTINVPCVDGADVYIVLDDLSTITLNLDGVTVQRWLDEAPSIAKRSLIGSAEVRIRYGVPPVIGETGKQSAPMPHEGSDGIHRERHERGGTPRHSDQRCNDAAFVDPLNVKAGFLWPNERPILIGERGKRNGEVKNVERLCVLHGDRQSRLRLAHMLGSPLDEYDDEPLQRQFRSDGTSFERLAPTEARRQ